MKTPTDLACQKFLAEQLPERIHIEESNPLPKTIEDAFLNPSKTIFLLKTPGLIKHWTEIRETEWLQIAQDVEWKIHWSDYFPAICSIVEHDWNQNSDVKYCDLPPAHRAWLVIHATYQQRAIALAKAMGKELA